MLPNSYNQCVFVRGFRVKKRIGIPRVLKAAAGPRDLGSSDPPDEISPRIEKFPEVASNDGSLEAIATTAPFQDPLRGVFDYIFEFLDDSIVDRIQRLRLQLCMTPMSSTIEIDSYLWDIESSTSKNPAELSELLRQAGFPILGIGNDVARLIPPRRAFSTSADGIPPYGFKELVRGGDSPVV
ncbi:hypothetical protein BU17DRAFT_72554, partial [Hysterangium stoloniferum]